MKTLECFDRLKRNRQSMNRATSLCSFFLTFFLILCLYLLSKKKGHKTAFDFVLLLFYSNATISIHSTDVRNLFYVCILFITFILIYFLFLFRGLNVLRRLKVSYFFSISILVLSYLTKHVIISNM